MRLWSLHPRHLDAKGLVALWREGLLARAVLLGKTRGYRAHPQLERFRTLPAPVAAIDRYLTCVFDEACRRGYAFDATKIGRPRGRTGLIRVTTDQLAWEWRHLLAKLRIRDRRCWLAQRALRPEPHPCFRAVRGPVASWERAGVLHRAPADKQRRSD